MTGRKDSLSINLEFVKVSLSRMRRTGGPTFIESFIPGKGGKMDTTLINISGKLSAQRDVPITKRFIFSFELSRRAEWIFIKVCFS